LNADSDGDGLVDGDEINTHRTDPLKADTEGEGLNDGEIVKIKMINKDIWANEFFISTTVYWKNIIIWRVPYVLTNHHQKHPRLQVQLGD